MKQKSMKIISTLLFAAFLVSCGTANKSNDEAVSIYNKWEVSVLDGDEVTTEQPIYLELTDDNKLSGFLGCNRLTGEFSIKNQNKIAFEILGTTRKACLPMDMELERRMIELLTNAHSFKIDQGVLTINNEANAILGTFIVASEQEIANKYWKLIELEGQAVEMADYQEREQYFMLRSNGTVMGFAGCNQFNGQYELTPDNHISFNDNMAVSMKACPDVDVDESAFLKVFQLSNSYVVSGDSLSLTTEDGSVIAAFEAIYF